MKGGQARKRKNQDVIIEGKKVCKQDGRKKKIEKGKDFLYVGSPVA